MRQGLDEEFYVHVGEYHGNARYSQAEQLAIEYAERFVLDHRSIDDDFFSRLRSSFTDAEVLDLTICIATFLGLGRVLKVLDIEETELDDV